MSGISTSFNSAISKPFNIETHSEMFGFFYCAYIIILMILLSFIILVIFDKNYYEKDITIISINCTL